MRALKRGTGFLRTRGKWFSGSLAVMLLFVFMPQVALASPAVSGNPLPTVTAAITTNMLSVLDVENGQVTEAGGTAPVPSEITIALSGENWDLTSSAQINTLISDLTAAPDSASWALVQAALRRGNTPGGNKYFPALPVTGPSLTIQLPAVPDYAPVKGQVLSVSIPKALLSSGSSPVSASCPLPLPSCCQNPTNSLASAIQQRSFISAFAKNQLDEMYLTVPTLYLKSIVSKQLILQNSGENTYVNSLDIYTDPSATQVKVTVTTAGLGGPYASDIPLQDTSGKTFFNVGFPTSSQKYGISITLDTGSTPNVETDAVLIAGTRSSYLPVIQDLSGSYNLYKLLNNSGLLPSILRQGYTMNNIMFSSVYEG